MKFDNITKTLVRQFQENQPEILAGIAVVGTAATAYLAARGGRKAQREIDNWLVLQEFETKREKLIFEAKVTWKCYIPAALAGAGTIAAITASAHTGRNRTAAAIAAYTLTEKAYQEYKDAVVEQIGEEKEGKVRDKLAQEKVDRQPATEVYRPDGGSMLCCELWTMRYFRADIESINRAVDKVNRIALAEEHGRLDDFYDLLGLDYTSQSHKVIWTPSKPMSLRVTYTAGPKGEPCMAFDYNNMEIVS